LRGNEERAVRRIRAAHFLFAALFHRNGEADPAQEGGIQMFKVSSPESTVTTPALFPQVANALPTSGF
jgi:hypothetical protein